MINVMFIKRYTYRRIDFCVQRHPSLYGHYVVECYYRGRNVRFITTDSKLFDYCDDELDKGRMKAARAVLLDMARAQWLTFYM